MADFNEEQLKRISFHLLTFNNPRARQHLLKNGIKAGGFFALSARQLQAAGLDPARIRAAQARNWQAARDEADRAQTNRIQIIFSEDRDYPPLLNEIYDPPDFIYFLGGREVLAGAKLAVVGSRRASAYGQAAINRLLPGCIRAGLVIVSGMAYGIDSMAHQAAIREKGATIGVNAGGLLHLNPPGNRGLIGRIAEHGGIISEFPLDVVPRPFLFPIRNRVIAGISKAVLVVEAAMRSGSLITARLAADQDRDVMAVPGNIDRPLSQGTNYLLQQGAKPVSSAADLLEEFGLMPPPAEKTEPLLTAQEKKILDLYGENEVKGIDFLVETLNLSTAEIVSLMMGLVLKNLVAEEADGYRRINDG